MTNYVHDVDVIELQMKRTRWVC